MALTDIGLIAEAIKAAAQVWYEYLKSADKRRAKACIEAGEKYIQVNEGEGEFSTLTPERKKQLLKHYAKRFWAYN